MILTKPYNDLKEKTDFKSIYNCVMDGKVFIIENVFSSNYCQEIQQKLIEYRAKIKSSNQDRLNSHSSFVRRDVNPVNSNTKHTFDSYCISTFDVEKDYIYSCTFKIFEELKKIYLHITDNNFDFGKNDLEQGFRPQIIHYPVGGGHFDYHSHPLNPQEIGLILNLSKPGEDYNTGSTVFKIDNQEVDIFKFHRQGYLAIFKYNLIHKVTEVDPGKIVDFKKGRFSAILPVL